MTEPPAQLALYYGDGELSFCNFQAHILETQDAMDTLMNRANPIMTYSNQSRGDEVE